MQKPTYRPDIEGLRAIAILAVVACHAKFPFMDGGFVGVDIFFVLSGYLITGLLVKEFDSAGKIDFISFYARRLKRLLPGLFLMLFVIGLAAPFTLGTFEQVLQTQTALAAVLWASNLSLIFADTNYFDPAMVNLFLHTWSLSVEEQFYLIWPFLIPLFMRGKVAILWYLAVIFLCCLSLSIVLSYQYPLWGFYSMPSRGWQFALGGIALLLTTHKSCSASNLAAISFVGLFLILASVLFIDEEMVYPGWAALAPSFGAALVLFAQHSPISSLLSTKPMQAVGRVSYSWYLWHWPVLLIGNRIVPEQGIAFQLILVTLSLVIAGIAYHTVELPVRNNAQLMVSPKKALMAFGLVIASSVLLANAHNRTTKASTMYMGGRFAVIRQDLPAPYFAGCDDQKRSARVRPCQYGNLNSENTAVLFADSIGTQWFSALEDKYVKAGWRFIVLVKSSCPIVDVDKATICDRWKDASLGYLSDIKPQVVFIGSSASYKLSADEWEAGTVKVLSSLAESSDKIYIIQSTPALEIDGLLCLSDHGWQEGSDAGVKECVSIKSPDPEEAVLSALQLASAEFDNAMILSFNSLVCPTGPCFAHNGSQIVYRDYNHITDTFVKSISKQVSDIIDQAQ